MAAMREHNRGRSVDELETYVVLRDTAFGRRTAEADITALRVHSPLGPPKSLGRHPRDLGIKALMRSGPPSFAVEVAGLRSREAEDARRDPRTVGVAPSMKVKLIAPVAQAAATSADMGIGWGLATVGATETNLTGAGIKVAVLDTGIYRQHKAFEGVHIEEKDFTGEGAGDDNGHGTHCAATIFGRSVRGARIGVAPGVSEACVGKVLDKTGGGNTQMLFEGLSWTIKQNVDAISMSLGFDFPGYVADLVADDWPVDLATSKALVAYRDNLRLFDNLMEQIKLLAPFDRGAVLVAASGNESKADKNPSHRIAVSLPAAANGIISVGALARSAEGLTVPPFSNTMPRVSAPGVAIWSAQHDTEADLDVKSGTSMACPHVAGVAALWWQWLRESGEDATALKVENRLLASVRSSVFAPGVRPLDRGDGLVSAPPRL
jgi:subtilisin family serine protease